MNPDIVILGAGPAGAMAAIGAKQSNPTLNVVMIDPLKRTHKVGEALLTGTVRLYEQVGILDDLELDSDHPKIGAAYMWGQNRDTAWHVNYPKVGTYPDALTKTIDGQTYNCAVHVKRHEHDQRLREIAMNRYGASFLENAVSDIHFDSNKITSITLDDGTILTPRYVIDCSGQRAIIGNKLKIREGLGNDRMAAFGYTKVRDWGRAKSKGFHTNRTNIVSTQKGWFWVIPFGEGPEDLVSIGFVSNDRAAIKGSFQEVLSRFPETKHFGLNDQSELFDITGNPSESLSRKPPYSFWSSALHGENWSLAGDAALFVDPILSQGVTLASSFGYYRGTTAAAAILGNVEPEASLSRSYYNEATVLLAVCSEWYANSSVEDWYLASSFVIKKGDGTSAEDHFRYVTNLENLAQDHCPFDDDTMKHIRKNLGVIEPNFDI